MAPFGPGRMVLSGTRRPYPHRREPPNARQRPDGTIRGGLAVRPACVLGPPRASWLGSSLDPQ